MTDVVDRKTRSRMMSGIGSKNTKPELIVRQALHRRGFRYKLHDKTLPGTPDLVLPRYRAVVFVNGCFWHGHQCSLFKWPTTRSRFWEEKITGNSKRDRENFGRCMQMGWRVLIISECAIKGRQKLGIEQTLENAIAWLRGGDASGAITEARWEVAERQASLHLAGSK